MACKTVLIAGVFYALGCNGGDGSEAAALTAPEPPAAQASETAQRPSKPRRTGLSLKDVARDMAWRQKVFDHMAQNEAAQNEKTLD